MCTYSPDQTLGEAPCQVTSLIFFHLQNFRHTKYFGSSNLNTKLKVLPSKMHNHRVKNQKIFLFNLNHHQWLWVHPPLNDDSLVISFKTKFFGRLPTDQVTNVIGFIFKIPNTSSFRLCVFPYLVVSSVWQSSKANEKNQILYDRKYSDYFTRVIVECIHMLNSMSSLFMLKFLSILTVILSPRKLKKAC